MFITTNSGSRPGQVTPENDEGIVTGQGNNPQHNTNNNFGSTANGAKADSKSIATLTAQLALQNHVVYKGVNGDFIATKWGQTCYCKDYASLAAFAKKVGAIHE